MTIVAPSRPAQAAARRFPPRGWTVPWELAALVFPLITVFAAAAGFLVGMPVTRWHMMGGLGMSLLLCLPGTAAGLVTRKLAVVATAIVAALAVAGISVMYSNPDAEAYHRPASMLMVAGWNPVFDATPEAVEAFRGPNESLRVWHVAYLPRAYWMFGAAVYRCLGFVEAADAFSILAVILSFCMVSRLLARTLGLRSWRRRAAATLVTASPAVAALTFGGSSDGASYSLFLLAVSAATLYLKTGRVRWLWHVVAALPLLANLKFTGVVCCGVIAAVYLAGCLLEWRARRAGPELAARWLLAVAASVGLAVVIGFSPYLTSWARSGGPFYPAHTFDKRVPTSHRITEDFLQMNDDARRMGYLGRFSYAYLSRSLTLAAYDRGPAGEPFAPRFGVSGGVGGFGPVFRVAFVLSLLVLPFARVGPLGFPLACILITVLLQPTMSMGYARYAPQFYAFPPLVFLAFARRLDGHARQPSSASDSRGRRSPRIMPLTLAAAVACYCLPLLAYPLSFLALQWIISVQNLEITKAMRQDPRPLVFTKTYYGHHTLDDDYGCSNVTHLASEADLPAEAAGFHPYGPYFSFYTYYSPRVIEGFPALSHTVSDNDPTIIASRNRRNFEFFLSSFLPRQLPRLPIYLLDVALLRCRQLAHAWTRADHGAGAGRE